MQQVVICRHCHEEFVLQPGKPGYRDECVDCWAHRAHPKATPAFDRLMSYIKKHPPVGTSEDGIGVVCARRVDIAYRLYRLITKHETPSQIPEKLVLELESEYRQSVEN